MDLGDDFHEIQCRRDRSFQIDAKEMTGGFACKPLLIEFEAGHNEHVVFAPGPAFLPLEHVPILFNLVGGDCEVEEFYELTDQSFRVGDVVGNANAIKTTASVE